MLPDYHGGSIVNLMASIIAARGGTAPAYAPLRGLGPEALAAARALVLIVIDGLGDRFLAAHGANGELHRRRFGAMTSVFPSTTATAITTFLTGEAPQQHGLTGWFMHFRAVGGVHAVLPMTPRVGAPPPQAAFGDAAGFFGHVPLFDRLEGESVVVSPAHIVDSPFNVAHAGRARRVGYRSLEEFFSALTDAVHSGASRRFVYAYWSELDRLAHDFGITHPETLEHFAALDAAFGRWLGKIGESDVRVLITADHGFVDADPATAVSLEDHPALVQMLRLPLCGERRVAYCYVQSQARADFEHYLREHFADRLACYACGKVLTQPYFGLGAPHPELADRIGDYVLIMKDRATIKDWLPGEKRYVHIGVHGGVSTEEMRVPLIAA